MNHQLIYVRSDRIKPKTLHVKMLISERGVISHFVMFLHSNSIP